MDIVPIFASTTEPIGLYVCRFCYEKPEDNELVRFKKLWSNQKHISKTLRNYKKELLAWPFYPNPDSPAANRQILREMTSLLTTLTGNIDLSFEDSLESRINHYVKNLYLLFEPLTSPDYNERLKAKAREVSNNALLRIYALEIAENLFLITGSGFKAVRATSQDLLLKAEIGKMDSVMNLLTQNNITALNFKGISFSVIDPLNRL